MPRFARFGLPDGEGSAVGVEVGHFEPGQLAVTTAGLQRCLHQRPELWIGGVDEPFRFRDREILDPRCVDALERFDLARCHVRGGLTVVEGMVERGPQDRQNAVSARAATARGFLAAVKLAVLLRLAWLGPYAGGTLASPTRDWRSSSVVSVATSTLPIVG